MTGEHNSFMSRLLQEAPWVVVIGCTCHSSALAASHACEKLSSNVMEFMRNVATYVGGSAKRSAQLTEFQDFYHAERQKILQPSGTRWLVLHPCVVRLLKLWPVLTDFFALADFEEKDNRKKQITVKILHEFRNPYTKVYMEFLKYVLNFFNTFNGLFQSKKVLVQKLYSLSVGLMKSLCKNFTQQACLADVATLNLSNPRAFLSTEDIYWGTDATALLSELEREHPQDVKTVRLRCLDFYIEASKQFQKRLPLKNDLFQEMEFLDMSKTLSSKAHASPLQNLSLLTTRFKEVLSLDEGTLAIEWRNLPFNVPEDVREELVKMEVDEAWFRLSKVVNFEDKPICSELYKLAKCVMSLPHSNADAERVFTIVTDVRTKKRNRISGETLNGVCVVRISFQSKEIGCDTFQVRKEHMDLHNSQNLYST